MNETSKLDRIRELAKAKALEVQPMSGEEMTQPQTDPHRDGFINGERALAVQILKVLDAQGVDWAEDSLVDIVR